MKKPFTPALFLLLIVFLSACRKPYQQTTFPNPGRLTQFPVPPSHQREVKIFFPGEAVKDTDYVKVMVLEVSAPANASYEELVNLMKTKAGQHGLDAVLLLAKDDKLYASHVPVGSYRLGNRNYFYRGYTYLSSYPVLSGLGIVYRHNLGYLTQYMKSQVITETATGKRLEVKLDLNRNAENPAELTNDPEWYFFVNFTKKYEPFYLLQQNKDWLCFSNHAGKLLKRYTYQAESTTNKKPSLTRICKFKYDRDTIREIRLSEPWYGSHYSILLTYDTQKRISETLIREGRKPILKQRFEYDNENRLVKSQFYFVEHNQEKAFLQSEYQYHIPQDFIRK